MRHELCIVLDFGGQYNQLIARRVREHGIYCEIMRFDTPIAEIAAANPKGIIFTGGPQSVNQPDSPRVPEEIFGLGVPILGICYGCQLMADVLGGQVRACEKSEYGSVSMQLTRSSPLFEGVAEESTVWMSHTDAVFSPPQGFSTLAQTQNCPCAAMGDPERKLYAVQFHPEVTHTAFGKKILENFLLRVCEFSADWRMDDFIETSVRELRETIGEKTVILGLSGGVDSAVAAALLSRAVGRQLTCVFVDHGLMRKDEGDFVEKTFTSLFDMRFVRVNCGEQFLSKLRGVTDPEQKRKIIGSEFYRIFWEKIREESADGTGFFAQGTIYPDRVESGRGNQAGSAATIKTHHNQVSLPPDIPFAGIVEPLKDLFKDEVRQVGEMLGIPRELVRRQPFPGPGLGVRIIGEVTREKIRILQEADAILRDEFRKDGLDETVSQFFAVLPGVRTVGVMGDHRTYEQLIAIRAVTTDDFMTADWARIPYDTLARVSARICNEVEGVNRVVYDITSKPPGTVEWE